MTKWKRLCRDFRSIHLVDRCLLVFMFVLLVQSAFNLLTQEGWSAQSNEIDVIVRTSAASIFGYFLSANFIRRSSEKSELSGTSLEMDGQGDEAAYQEEHETGGTTLQVLVATVIGLFCLLTLIIMRNIQGLEPGAAAATSAATVTQFRDFVSGCVGFLIGCPTSERK